jgi:type II secretory pathway component PulJ
VTLIELLAALVISAIVIALVSRVFLSGHRQYLTRLLESEQLTEAIHLKRALNKTLQAKILECKSGRLKVRMNEQDQGLETWLKAEFPKTDSVSIKCFEWDETLEKLVPWESRFQPQLIEYRVLIGEGGPLNILEGSVLK